MSVINLIIELHSLAKEFRPDPPATIEMSRDVFDRLEKELPVKFALFRCPKGFNQIDGLRIVEVAGHGVLRIPDSLPCLCGAKPQPDGLLPCGH